MYQSKNSVKPANDSVSKTKYEKLPFEVQVVQTAQSSRVAVLQTTAKIYTKHSNTCTKPLFCSKSRRHSLLKFPSNKLIVTETKISMMFF